MLGAISLLIEQNVMCLTAFVGVSDYKLVVKTDEIVIQEKKVTLKLDSLRPHGKISLIL